MKKQFKLGVVVYRHVGLNDMFLSVPNDKGFFMDHTLLCGRYSAPGILVKIERVNYHHLFPLNDYALALEYVSKQSMRLIPPIQII